MEQLIIKVADKEKAQMLLTIISALDFVNSVESEFIGIGFDSCIPYS
jgi:hypothetical protein